jgi:hypothetical protein
LLHAVARRIGDAPFASPAADVYSPSDPPLWLS